MNNQEAREILKRYRPGVDDGDSQFAEALQMAQRDPELTRWLDEHIALHTAIRGKLKQIQPPATLKATILAAKPGREPLRLPRNSLVLLAAAAAIALIIAFGGLWFNSGSDAKFSEYRDRMIHDVARGYTMTVASSDMAVIKNYFATNHTPSDFSASKPLDQLPLLGAATEYWYTKAASMVCYSAGGTNNAWLFVATRKDMTGMPPQRPPQIETMGTPPEQFTSASWSADGLVYILVVKDKDDLKKLLPP